MASTTALKIIKKAFQKAGILTKNQTPTAQEAQDALEALNAMIESWANDSLMCFARSWENFPLTANQAVFTMGTGGDFNTPRPVAIISAYCRLGTTDYPVTVINDENYFNSIATKSQVGQTEWLNNDNAFPLINLRPWPIASAGYTIFLLTEKPLTSFSSLTSTVNLPPGWERALIFNLPEEIAGDYGQEVPQTVQKIAVESKSLIQKSILKNHNLDCNPSQVNPGNIYTGWNR